MMGLFDRLAVATLPLMPRPLMRRVASRYIAGETLEEALDCLSELESQGHPGIIDILGEDAADESATRRVVADYRRALEGVAARELDAYVSVKPTHVGLRISEALCLENYDELARACGAHGRRLRVEMEDHTTTDATLRVFERLRESHANVGIVLQSRLKRTADDIRSLAPGPLDVRMVKGIYLEPAPIAHVDPEPIREAFLEDCRLLFERGARVAFATHDEVMAENLLALCHSLDLPRERFGFQVLLGVRRELWERWRSAGHEVRVYVPYGPEWRPYSLRRLTKNPQIFRHVLRDVLSLRR